MLGYSKKFMKTEIEVDTGAERLLDEVKAPEGLEAGEEETAKV